MTLLASAIVFAARIKPGLAFSKTRIMKAITQSFGSELPIFEVSNPSGIVDFASYAHVSKCLNSPLILTTLKRYCPKSVLLK